LLLGLGLFVGAVCRAQEPPQPVPPPSSVPPQQDTTQDTTGVRSAAHADSIKALYHPDTTRSRAPLAHAPVPPLLEVGRSYRWDRAALDASGALTLTDLLDKVPGFTGFRAGWLSTPMQGAYFGDIARVRVFVDGIEMDPLDSRLHGLVDLATIQLWEFEEVAVERGASELRVYCRTWRANRVTPATRADVFTGNEQTNLYKAYYGQRFGPGFAGQVGAYQFNNTGSFGGGGNQSSIVLRVGYASGPFSIDAFGNRFTRGRDVLQSGNPFLPITQLPDLESQRTDAYVRVGYGDPDHGRPWLQVIAASMSFKNTSPAASATTPIITDTTQILPISSGSSIDSVNSESQYIASGGFVFAGIRFEGTDRFRVFSTHGNYNSGELRASFENPILSASAFVQRDAYSEGRPDSAFIPASYPTLYNSEELSARFSPFSFVRFVGTASRVTPQNLPSFLSTTQTTARAEAGLKLGDVWFSGGVMTQDTAIVPAPLVYDTTMKMAAYGRTTALIASIRGRLWREIYVDASGVDWDKAEPYRPKYQGHAETYLATEWLRQFPRHTFAVKFGVSFDYRSATEFPAGSAVTAIGQPFYSVADSRVWSVMAEIKILQGTLSWQLRNASGYPYYLVPGYQMPRQVNIYGLRWDFWN